MITNEDLQKLKNFVDTAPAEDLKAASEYLKSNLVPIPKEEIEQNYESYNAQQPVQDAGENVQTGTEGAYQAAMNALQKASKTTLASQYTPAVQEAYNAIVNRPKFSYDVNTDELYKQYRDQYTRMGKRAAEDVMAQASGLTGGYGSTYAESVAAQQYNNYMQALNDKIPELYNAAYNRYADEGNDMWQQYNALSNMEASDYARQSDDRAFQYNAAMNDLANYWQERGYYDNREDALWNQNMAERQYADNLAYQQWQQNMAEREFNAGQTSEAWARSLQQQQLNLSAQQAQQDYAMRIASLKAEQENAAYNRQLAAQQMAYQQQRDSVSDYQWQQNYSANLAKQQQQFALEQQKLQTTKNAATDKNMKEYSAQAQRRQAKSNYDVATKYIYSLYSGGKISYSQAQQLIAECNNRRK